jgi:uncharacterized protein YoxC
VSPLGQSIIVICVVAVTVALVMTLLRVKRAVIRAESLLELVERELRPLAGQVEGLAQDLRSLSRQVTAELERVSVVVRRLEELTMTLGRIAGAVASVSRVGQVAGVATGLKRGLDVFVSRMKRRAR